MMGVGGVAQMNAKKALSDAKKLEKNLYRKLTNSARQIVLPAATALARKTPVSKKGYGQVGFTQSNWGIRGEGIGYSISKSLGPNKSANANTLKGRWGAALKGIKKMEWKIEIINETPSAYHINAGSRSMKNKGMFDRHFAAMEKRAKQLFDKWFGEL